MKECFNRDQKGHYWKKKRKKKGKKRKNIVNSTKTEKAEIKIKRNFVKVHSANRLQRWVAVLLNYNFKMELLLLKSLGHADGLSRLIPKLCDPLEDSVIATLTLQIEIKSVLCNTIRKLPVMKRLGTKQK